ncbi:MAG: hypothetical protein JWQ57_3558, partial [Mucilaginibacter sp.]|nr:hypothetical protein [Mucilaginibacter sp.]
SAVFLRLAVVTSSVISLSIMINLDKVLQELYQY